MNSIVFLFDACRHRGPKEYIERNGLHSAKKPHVVAEELGALSKKQQKAYMKQLKRAKKDINKRNQRKAKGGYYDN